MFLDAFGFLPLATLADTEKMIEIIESAEKVQMNIESRKKNIEKDREKLRKIELEIEHDLDELRSLYSCENYRSPSALEKLKQKLQVGTHDQLFAHCAINLAPQSSFARAINKLKAKVEMVR